MPYYAKIENDVVVELVTCEPNDPAIASGEWVEASFNTYGGINYEGGVALRKNTPLVGYTYDREKDAFINVQFYETWVLNQETCMWEAPIPKPDLTNIYTWDDLNQNWVKQ